MGITYQMSLYFTKVINKTKKKDKEIKFSLCDHIIKDIGIWLIWNDLFNGYISFENYNLCVNILYVILKIDTFVFFILLFILFYFYIIIIMLSIQKTFKYMNVKREYIIL